MNTSAAETEEAISIRLSRPGAAALVHAVADSLGDRLGVAADPRRGDFAAGPTAELLEPAGGDATSVTVSRMLDGMTAPEFLQLARHALDASLEALESNPVLASKLLPSTACVVRAQIAGGCVVQSQAPEQGYVVAEIDIAVWEQLLQADRRTVPIQRLDRDEAADRRRLLLEELAIDIRDMYRYRKDERVAIVLRDLGS